MGRKHFELRTLFRKNLAFIRDAEFGILGKKLSSAGIAVNCFGSGIVKWAKPVTGPPDSSYEDLRLAIPRMKKLGIGKSRPMSFTVQPELAERSWKWEKEVVEEMRILVKIAEDVGILLVQENCMNRGELFSVHTL